MFGVAGTGFPVMPDNMLLVSLIMRGWLLRSCVKMGSGFLVFTMKWLAPSRRKSQEELVAQYSLETKRKPYQGFGFNMNGDLYENYP
jgi:hypothetical protein